MAEQKDQEFQWLAVIAKSLAFLSLDRAQLRDTDIGVQARFLIALGLSRTDCAGLLNSTEKSISELLRLLEKKRSKSHAKKTNKPKQ